MLAYIKSFFRHPTAEELRKLMLDKAQRDLLMAEAELESAMSLRAMLKARVARLSPTN